MITLVFLSVYLNGKFLNLTLHKVSYSNSGLYCFLTDFVFKDKHDQRSKGFKNGSFLSEINPAVSQKVQLCVRKSRCSLSPFPVIHTVLVRNVSIVLSEILFL